MITLWDPDSNTLLHEFANHNQIGNSHPHPIKQIAFVGRVTIGIIFCESRISIYFFFLFCEKIIFFMKRKFAVSCYGHIFGFVCVELAELLIMLVMESEGDMFGS